MTNIKFKILIIFLVVISCTIGTKGVYFNEMSNKPTIMILEGKIILKTNNSKENSALLIYRIDFNIDTINKVIEIKGFQAINKKYKTTFELDLRKIAKEQLDNYQYVWIDPDKNRNRIENINK